MPMKDRIPADNQSPADSVLPVWLHKLRLFSLSLRPKGERSPSSNEAQSVQADDVIDQAIPVRGLPDRQTGFTFCFARFESD